MLDAGLTQGIPVAVSEGVEAGLLSARASALKEASEPFAERVAVVAGAGLLEFGEQSHGTRRSPLLDEGHKSDLDQRWMDGNKPLAGGGLQAFPVVGVGRTLRDEEAVYPIQPMDIRDV